MTVAIALAGVGAGVGRGSCAARRCSRSRWRSRSWSINALVEPRRADRDLRLGELPVLGQTDITLEATVYGAILGLRAVALILCGALYTAAVDPDEVLRLFRACLVSLGADRDAGHADGAGAGARLAGGSPTRSAAGPAAPPSRLALMRAATAACSTARSTSPPRSRSAATAPRAGRPACARPYSRHDLAFAASAVGDRRRWRSRRGSPAWRRSTPTRRSTAPLGPASSRWLAGCSRWRWRRSRIARDRTVRGPSGDRAVSVLELDGVSYTLPGRRARRRCATSTLEVAPGELVVLAGASGSGKSTLLRAASGLVPALPRRHVRRPGRRRRARHPRRTARASSRRGRHAVPGPRDPGRDGDRAGRAGVPAREPGRRRGGGRARRSRRRRSRSGSRQLLDRSDRRAVRRRAAARRARRGAGRPPGAAGARRADLAARPGRRRRADRRCCGGSTRTATRRSCSPSTGSSAAWRAADRVIALDRRRGRLRRRPGEFLAWARRGARAADPGRHAAGGLGPARRSPGSSGARRAARRRTAAGVGPSGSGARRPQRRPPPARRRCRRAAVRARLARAARRAGDPPRRVARRSRPASGSR